MTLVVYKNNMLAADTRTTHHCTAHRNNNCAHCGKKATSVNDGANKIVTALRRAVFFREDKILAMAGAGDKAMIERVQRIVKSGENLEQVYEHYRMLHGSTAENQETCSMLLVGEKMNYVARIPRSGELIVHIKEKDKHIFLGSGTNSADWISKLLPHLDAAQIVNLAMHDDVSVGGNIDYIDFNKSDWSTTWHQTKYPKLDPQSMLDGMIGVFKRGREAMIEDQKKTLAAASPRVRKSTRPKPQA